MRRARSIVHSRRLGALLAALATPMLVSCGDDDANVVDVAADQEPPAPPPVTPEETPQSEATLARDYVAGWQRCLYTTRRRTEQAWSRYELAFKPAEGRVRGKDVEPYVYGVSGTLRRCSTPGAPPAGVATEVSTAGAAYLKSTQIVADTVTEIEEALAAEGAREGGFASIATLGPRFGTEYEAWAVSAQALADVLEPARDQVDEVWLAEIKQQPQDALAWLVGRAMQSGRKLATCLTAAPKAPECAEAIAGFDAAAEALKSYGKAHPEARLGAFWLDVFLAKIPITRAAADAMHTTKTSGRRLAALTPGLSADLRDALIDLALAGDRVRFDFP